MIGITIAGLDPSGGAGILTDVKTLASYNIHPTSVVTALTAQNPSKVYSVKPISVDFINEQFDSVLSEYDIGYGKTGLLYSKDIIKAVSKKVIEYDLKIVVDPVMVASAGDKLSENNICKSFKKYLLPQSILTTPNVSEAEQLSGIEIKSKEDAIEAAYKIGDYCNVIITGGHLNGVNTFYNGEVKVFNQELIESDNTHGSGCTFSAAIVANLIKNNDMDLFKSINEAMDFTFNSILNGRYKTLNPNFISKKISK